MLEYWSYIHQSIIPFFQYSNLLGEKKAQPKNQAGPQNG